MILPEQILVVAQRLGELREQVVFLGGMVRGTLVTDPAVRGPRQTLDVDVILEVSTQVARVEINERLRKLGFQEDMSEDAPICRHVLKQAFHGQNLLVDFMPLDAAILGFSNTWYPSSFAHAQRVETPVGAIRVIDAPHFIATKLESFRGRGQGDFAHHDMEDAVVVVDGRDSIVEEVGAAPAPVSAFIAKEFSGYLRDKKYVQNLAWHLPPDEMSQARLPQLMARLQALAGTL